MANYRTIKFTYNSTTLEIDVLVANERTKRNEIRSIFESANGTRYKQVLGSNINYSYQIALCDSDVFEFFETAHAQGEGTFERQKDDGTFDSYTGAYLEQPQYEDETVGTTGKLYRDVKVTVAVK